MADSTSEVFPVLEDAEARGHISYLILLDIKSAFGRIPHSIVIEVLHELGFCDNLLAFLQGFLRGRSYHIRVNGVLNSPRLVLCGVPQGSVVSPFLFNLALAQLPSCFPASHNCNVRVTINMDDITLCHCT